MSMEETIKQTAKSAFEIWQQTVEEAFKNLPKAFNTGELSDEISRIRKKKDWIKFVDAQKEIDHLNDLLLKYNQEAVDYEQKVESERFELKQKLDVFHGFLVKVHNQSRDVKVMAFLGGIIKKFEELKEDENHE